MEQAVRALLDFIADKYGDVETATDFTCPHHRKLAELVGWTRKAPKTDIVYDGDDDDGTVGC